MADLTTAEHAVNSGASLITHLFNAMLPVKALITSPLSNGNVFLLVSPPRPWNSWTFNEPIGGGCPCLLQPNC